MDERVYKEKLNRWRAQGYNVEEIENRIGDEKAFKEFEDKLYNLKELEVVLRSIDTKGYEEKVEKIYAKMKDVRNITEIKEDIINLRDEIEKAKAKGAVIPKELLEEMDEVGIERSRIKGDVWEIMKEVLKKKMERKKAMLLEIEREMDRWYIFALRAIELRRKGYDIGSLENLSSDELEAGFNEIEKNR
ncbi:MAG: hypothetical protein AB1779_02860 [Candidatus Thermoplasmatota archaeon]